MQFDHYEYKIADHYLSALINGDESGLEDDDAEQLNNWIETAENDAKQSGVLHWHWADMEDTGEDYGRCAVSGLFAMCCTVRLMFTCEGG